MTEPSAPMPPALPPDAPAGASPAPPEAPPLPSAPPAPAATPVMSQPPMAPVGPSPAPSGPPPGAAAAPAAPSPLAGLSGPDTLILGGAALFLIVGEILLGEIFTSGGISLGGVLAGEVLFFGWFMRPQPGKSALLSAGVVQALVAAFVLAIFLFEVGDFISTLKNLGGFTSLGLVAILVSLCRWAGAILMGLGVVSAWSSPTAPAPAPPIR